ncbi:hypothetical protein AB6A40_006926 [Gnathostoma spinigerum]|uniref:AMP deaminase n=1 Tax=Gnathostoma spinigerum TaxID=75299 RepID=A0ABD6ELZ1_9BILA
MSGRIQKTDGHSRTPPAVNFFTNNDERSEEMDAKIDRNSASSEESVESYNPVLESARNPYGSGVELPKNDSDIFSRNSSRSSFDDSKGQHLMSAPFEILRYPIEEKETKAALERQMISRSRSSSKTEPESLISAQAVMTPNSDDYQKMALNGKRSLQKVEMSTFRDAVDVNFQRMAITGEELSGVPLDDLKRSAKQLIEALALRYEYMTRIGCHFPSTTKNFLTGYYPANLPRCRRKNTEKTSQMSFNPPEPPEDHWGLSEPLPKYNKMFHLKRKHGVIQICEDSGEVASMCEKTYLPREKFLHDSNKLTQTIADGPLKSFCFRRLSFLGNKFELHTLLNELLESREQRMVSHRDFYNIRKVDTHIHAASSMNQKHLLRFIKKKMKTEKDTVVAVKNGKPITLAEVFENLGLNAYDLSVDMLDVHADRNTFHRFDKFNTKYNPVGESLLREIFIKTDNYVKGKYFAEVLKEVISDLEDSRYQHAEPRLSIYGRNKNEWDDLAQWAISHDVFSRNVRWLVQIPRLFDVYRSKNMLDNFDQMLDNIFTPLFEVTNDPSSHAHLHRFLQYVSGIDSVDDESKHENVHFDQSTPEPKEYTLNENPPYRYYLYYFYVNLAALNAFRRFRGLNTFALRPHCGEAGHVNHLVAGYLTSESISHGLVLRKVPVLQYLFYLTQVGIAMSPLSNNSLFISYHRNPLPDYLKIGLNVSLSTDDPLQFHFTKEALMEEYSIAAQVWKLSSCDMCELARNSVLQSGFEHKVSLTLP